MTTDLEREAAQLRETLSHIEQLLGVAGSEEEGAGLEALKALIAERDDYRRASQAAESAMQQLQSAFDISRAAFSNLTSASARHDTVSGRRIDALCAELAAWRRWASRFACIPRWPDDVTMMDAISDEVKRLQSQLDDERTEVELKQAALAGVSADNDKLLAENARLDEMQALRIADTGDLCSALSELVREYNDLSAENARLLREHDAMEAAARIVANTNTTLHAENARLQAQLDKAPRRPATSAEMEEAVAVVEGRRGRDFDPFGPMSQVPADIVADIKTERGLAPSAEVRSVQVGDMVRHVHYQWLGEVLSIHSSRDYVDVVHVNDRVVRCWSMDCCRIVTPAQGAAGGDV